MKHWYKYYCVKMTSDQLSQNAVKNLISSHQKSGSPLAFIIIFFKDLIKIHLRFSQNTRVTYILHVANCFNLCETLKLVHNMKTTFFQMLECISF